MKRTQQAVAQNILANGFAPAEGRSWLVEAGIGPFQGAPDQLTRRTELLAAIIGQEPTPAHRAYVDAVGQERIAHGLGLRGFDVLPQWCSGYPQSVRRPVDLPPYRLRIDGAGQLERIA